MVFGLLTKCGTAALKEKKLEGSCSRVVSSYGDVRLL